jgi:uncharacterized RDD family membrane protein YckC
MGMDQSAIGNRQSAMPQGAVLPRAEVIGRARAQVRVHKIRAPFALRCGALLIDYIVLATIVVISTLIARMAGSGARSAGSSTETIGLLIALAAAVLDFGVLAGVSGQTVGKWATGLRIERTNGQDMSIGRAMLRHFVGYAVSFLTLGIGFMIGAINARGRTVQDLIAGTVVVREEVAAPRT